MEKTKAELKETTDNIDNMIQQKINETQNIIYKKNELYIQGSIAYLELMLKFLKTTQRLTITVSLMEV